MSTTKIEDVRRIISNKVVEHIRKCEETKTVKNLIIRSFPGSGKTVSVMKSIDKAGYNWIYLSPFHEIITENLEYSKHWDYSFIHLKGKNQEGVCFAEQYRKLLEMNISITPFCETRCPYKDNGCPYYETKKKIESFPLSWAGVHSHIPTYLQSFLFLKEYNDKKMFKYYDVIIIDEFPFQCLFNQVSFTKKDADYLRNIISYMKDSNEKDFVNRFLEFFSLTTKNIGLKYKDMLELLKTSKLDFDYFYDEYEKVLLDLIFHKTIESPPLPILYSLKTVYEAKPTLDKLKWMIYKKKWDGWSRGCFYMTTSNIKYFQKIPIPIIGLDATADVNAWNMLLNSNCEEIKIDMEYKNLYQLKSNGRYPTSSWVDVSKDKRELSAVGKKLSDLIIKICGRKKNDVLLCSNKRIAHLLSEYLKENYSRDNYKFAIYYNLRSRNSFYETCDTCIITHEPNIPPLQLRIMKEVTDWDMDLLTELMTKSEIKQAIGRIRQNIRITELGRIRDKIEVYILTGANREENKIMDEAVLIDYKNMYVGNIITIGEILKNIIRKEKQVSFSGLRDALSDVCSVSSLKSELKKLYRGGFISNYKRIIKWTYDDEKNKRIKYIIK